MEIAANRPLHGENYFDVKLFHLHFCITFRVLMYVINESMVCNL
jgi:hypothetical protein